MQSTRDTEEESGSLGEGAAIDTQSAAIITEAEWGPKPPDYQDVPDEFVAFNPRRRSVLVRGERAWNAGLGTI